MKFAIITHVSHKFCDGHYFAYGPYVREMNIWGEFVGEIEIVAPMTSDAPDPIDLSYSAEKIKFTKVSAFDLLGIRSVAKALLYLPVTAYRVFRAMERADHIHLRCPGNMGLVASFVQILFPSKPKTAKYAGNWDLEAAQPWSYRLQKWVLNNVFLTRNIKVLVYGEWSGSSSNVVPFFTATYRKSDVSEIQPRDLDNVVRLLFVGSLSAGKRPLYAVRMAEALRNSGVEVRLDLFGEGQERDAIEAYVVQNNLSGFVVLHGNRPEHEIREAYKHSHFLLLPSKSEGWPKVVAEAMFWSAVPVATNVSCVPWMLGNGKRGLQLTLDLDKDVEMLSDAINDQRHFRDLAVAARDWSQYYTLDNFGNEIKHMLHDKN